MQTQRQAHYLVNILFPLIILVTSPIAAWGQVRGNHYIHNIKGEVSVKRFLVYWQAHEGDRLTSNTRLKVDANSKVTLVCSNHTRHLLPKGSHTVSSYCPADIIRVADGRPLTRGPFQANLPYIISPRKTSLLGDQALHIKWHPSLGATTYQVTVIGPGVNWQTQVNQPEVLYPSTVSFQPGHLYAIRVHASNGLSSKTGIIQLTSTEATHVTAEIEKIKTLELDPDIEAISMALFYKNYSHSDSDAPSYPLNHRALEILDKRIVKGTENSQIYLLLAEIYAGIDLPLKAKEYYQQALEFSLKADQPNRQVESYLGLGRIAEEQKEYHNAIRYLKSAQVLINKEGDTKLVKQLQIQIQNLENKKRKNEVS